MSASDWNVCDESELIAPLTSGGRIRAYCHLHGGDHQRSLSIDEGTGFGECHQCKRQVLVRDRNHQAALNIEKGQARISRGEIRVHDPRHIMRKAAQAPKPRVIRPEQQQEIDALRSLHDSMVNALDKDRPRAYIEGRGLNMNTALSCGVGYVPIKDYRGKWEPLNAWRDHIVFPTWNPIEGQQFAGRKLWLWHPGMNEDEHGALLKQRMLNKYHKSHSNGWFLGDILNDEAATEAIFVEGPFDALASLEGGFLSTAIVGTSLEASWIPKHIKKVTLALDGDVAGTKKAEETRKRIYLKGYDAVVACPPDDGRGKDWSARYRVHGYDGLAPLLETV